MKINKHDIPPQLAPIPKPKKPTKVPEVAEPQEPKLPDIPKSIAKRMGNSITTIEKHYHREIEEKINETT